MKILKGRLIDHIHLRVADLQRSKTFYRAVANALNIDSFESYANYFTCDELFVSPADDTITNVHLAFQADSREMVAKFHAAALANGGSDNGQPGERNYHPSYFAAYVLDPDGNNVEAVNHGAADRSADAVVFTVSPED